MSNLFLKLAGEDHEALGAVVSQAKSEAARLDEKLREERRLMAQGHRPDPGGSSRNDLSNELWDLSREGFSVRLDAKQGTTPRRLYLTKAKASMIKGNGYQVVSWTSPWAVLRHLAPGESDEVKVPRGEVEATLELKGMYQPTMGDLQNGTYHTQSGRFSFKSALELLQQGQPTPSPQPPRSAPRSFGLREIIFETDRVQDTELRYPIDGHLVIEGAPGSGKTTIALQRVVYVLNEQFEELEISREEPHFTEEDSLVVTYSEILVHYLEKLLKDLKVPHVKVIDQETWLRNILDGAHALDDVQRDRVKDKRPAVVLKSTPSILPVLKKFAFRWMNARWLAALSGVGPKLESHLWEEFSLRQRAPDRPGARPSGFQRRTHGSWGIDCSQRQPPAELPAGPASGWHVEAPSGLRQTRRTDHLIWRALFKTSFSPRSFSGTPKP